jgi:hypothetical protein
MNNRKAYIITGILIVCIITIFSIGIVMANNRQEPLLQFKENYPEHSVVNNTVVTDIPENPSVVNYDIPVSDSIAHHIKTPEKVNAWYMSAGTASDPSLRTNIINTIPGTTINALVIDIKDATGKISFSIDDPIINELGSSKNLIKYLPEFIQELHEKNIYVIGRISVFQDPYAVIKKPEWALKSKKTRTPWKDKKGLSFLDPTNQDVWNYIVSIATKSYELGFDEINFDYIRFPSDGNIRDISYPNSEISKSDLIKIFFEHLDKNVRQQGIPTSADLFGMVTNTTDDMGIGQVLEKAMPYFDYIAPMIYPSHYPKGFHGFANPAAKPYDIITIAMNQGVSRAVAAGFTTAKFRPWIQDFNLGSKYTAPMIEGQIRALHEQGIDSYMSWNASNIYTINGYTTH